MRWSSEPKRRKIIVVAGVEEVSCLSASTSSVSQPSPELNQWQIWRAFAKAVHSWGPRCCVVVGFNGNDPEAGIGWFGGCDVRSFGLQVLRSR